jgi:glutamate-ammonia-ligase adenylyltransferase
LFQDELQAEKYKERLQTYTDLDLSQFWKTAFAESPDPDRALINLERWLAQTSNPGTYLTHLASSPRLAILLIDLLGASQPMADSFIQNPELASVITDPSEISRLPDKEEVRREGRALLANAGSYLHKLDRLRYLKQRWRLPIVVSDLAGAVQPELVWTAISDLADAILELCLETVWKEYSEQKQLSYGCPIMVAGFGKLGGHELNYSSDVDLVYVLQDDADERVERHAIRLCEMFSRAITDTMGRGSLYRVDLRLRPFGNSGPVSPSMKAVEAYYRSHAEIWEAQALIRSRPICGLPEYWQRWDALIERHCFPKYMSEFTLTSIFETRNRIEEFANEDDLKRGPGGIRDVEFLTQVLQMTHGFGHPSVRVASTIKAIEALASASFLNVDDAAHLEEGYIFLRQVEHRCQLVNDQQTHSIPPTPEAREHLARLMGMQRWSMLEAELSFQRKRIRGIYDSYIGVGKAETTARDQVLQGLNSEERSLVGAMFDHVPESAEFYRSLLENEGSLARVKEVVNRGPRLVPRLAETLPVTEAIVSGEIEEPLEAKLPPYDQSQPIEFAKNANLLWLHKASAWTLDSSFNLGRSLSELYDSLIIEIAKTVGGKFDIIALGSYGCMDVSVVSDLDLLLLVSDEIPQGLAEQQAQDFLAEMDGLKRFGWKTDLDLRLRPEGGKGLLVRSHTGFGTYELERMEMWERFALGMSRLVFGNPDSLQVAIRAAYAEPLTPERLLELVDMKKRIETERVQPQYWKRDVKLGGGSISDIDWLVHLYEMRYPTALQVGQHITVQDRLRRMAQAQLINALERDQLLYAREHLLKTRNFLSLLGFTADVVPENPDKLDKLALALGKTSGYEFLREHEAIIDSVRVIYLEGLERLGV